MGVDGQLHAPAALPSVKTPGSHCTKSWMGPRAGLDGYGQSHPHWGSNPGRTSPYTSRRMDCAIAALCTVRRTIQFTHHALVL
jgi:hypothetical protein